MNWNWAEAHLWINHLPVFGMAFGLVLLVYAMASRSEEMTRAALILFVLTRLGTIPAYMTGDPAEHIVRSMPEVDQATIDEHSDWGTAALILIEAAAIGSLAGLWLSHKSGSAPAALIRGTLALAILAFAIVGWTSHLGGQVHHPEARSGFVPPPRVPRSRSIPAQ
jgi:hypothetical protein